ncbi:50S ribosomal protein L23 [bacterium]|nr:50S ribosomal protein L23 [bacterium]
MNVRLDKVLKRPIQTEKTTMQKETANQVVFEVYPGADKLSIKYAVEKAFSVKVDSVQTMVVPSKRKKPIIGRRRVEFKKANWKKAIVKLAPGEKIELFEGV